ncbi:ATP-dependent RNA helicase DbpA [Devosia equisanguinis]|uniref:ATP-dependent RNA helicase DbpA n=1 Tax=Devosia equisanguinis TaxID=2490941 RepID=A0A447I8M6_9HYPH|nr:DEAD/DEAH box helicase family protein [Devosia equisanguinis]VDS03882.1 ATP-dependent RNA helicase DbpA [Devosia equisanguinis]
MIDKSGEQNEEVAQFLGDLAVLRLKTEYRSIKESPATAFYRPCLQHSIRYKRAAGYFRSTVFFVTGGSVVEFARRGGKMLLICSPELEEGDIDAIALGYAKKSEVVVDRLTSQIDRMLSDDATAYQTRVLATLVAIGALEVKLAFRADRKGLYHEKIGIFVDGLGNRVSFKGSANETWSAWDPSGNFESIEVFCSWRGGLEAERIAKHETHFDLLWSETDPDIEVFSFPSLALDRLKQAAFKGLSDVTGTPSQLTIAKREPMSHQLRAIAGWEEQGSRGIFEHATGSGKTFTAIVALSRHLDKGLPVLVLVPSQLLLVQWAKELRDEVPSAALLLAGAGNNDWKLPRRLKSMTDRDPALGARLVLATMQTASSPEFLGKVSGGDHLMIVGDEVHQSGSPRNSRIYDLATGPRLGLSATPTRYGDPEGTANMFRYFGPVVPPSITLNDAIEAGRLVPYEYFPHPMHLSATEAAEWTDLSRAIQLEIARQRTDENGRKPISERAKMLLIRRSRIAKKASAKIDLAVQVLKDHFEDGQSWLVYCEDSDQLGVVLNNLKSVGIDAVEYHSSMSGDRDETLLWYRKFGGVLVSIRCLDEGVDIPSISHALILASSQNPRQFIQRRGRVLRKSPDKDIAVIHDAIVVPVSAEQEQDQMGLLKAELVRSIEFSSHAINRAGGAELRAIAIEMGIDPDTLSDDGIESDD